MRKVVAVITACMMLPAIADVSPDPSIPVVPAGQALENLPPPPDSHRVARDRQASDSAGQTATERTRITLKPGTNELVKVAVNHLNRIVTPYSEPRVTTSSQVTTEVRDNVIYIGTTETAPITLFITEKGSEDEALSVTLIPREIPPREIILSLAGGTQPLTITRKAESWEQAQPYIATIEQLFRSLARGELPPGYQFDQGPKGQLPACRQTGLRIDFSQGQTVLGNRLIVHIGVATNASSKPLEFIEDACGDWDVAAVAAFPRNALQPGERTEIYVAMKRDYVREITVKRPSLLRGGR